MQEWQHSKVLRDLADNVEKAHSTIFGRLSQGRFLVTQKKSKCHIHLQDGQERRLQGAGHWCS